MAKVELKFLDCEVKNCHVKVSHIDVEELLKGKHRQIKNEHVLCISLTEFGTNKQIWLDIPTAIKFAKTLRTEINKAKEVNNG